MVYNRMTARIFARYYGRTLYMREVSNGAVWRHIVLSPCDNGDYVLATRNEASGFQNVLIFNNRKEAIAYVAEYWTLN